MADEIRITSSVDIIKMSGNNIQLQYANQPKSFTLDMTGALGPTPGAIQISPNGTIVDFSGTCGQLTTPAVCVFINYDATDAYSYGRWDATIQHYYPLGKVRPLKHYVIELDDDVEDEYTGTGTQTLANLSYLMVKAKGTSTINGFVGAFEV